MGNYRKNIIPVYKRIILLSRKMEKKYQIVKCSEILGIRKLP